MPPVKRALRISKRGLVTCSRKKTCQIASPLLPPHSTGAQVCVCACVCVHVCVCAYVCKPPSTNTPDTPQGQNKSLPTAGSLLPPPQPPPPWPPTPPHPLHACPHFPLASAIYPEQAAARAIAVAESLKQSASSRTCICVFERHHVFKFPTPLPAVAEVCVRVKRDLLIWKRGLLRIAYLSNGEH